MRKALKLLALLAVLLMPFSMVPAASHSSAATEMPMQHCPDQGSKRESKASFGECMMACSAALPAETRADVLPVTIICAAVQPVVTHRLTGLHPETAKPPPKLG